MEIKCNKCNSILASSNLKFSCSHFLCNKCLSRELLLKKFFPLTKEKSVEMSCSCGGKITVPFDTCLKNISGVEIQKKKNKYCKQHKEKSDTYCQTCRIWLCPQCISDFHNANYKTHKLCSEDKLITSKCFYHRQCPNELFCKDCNKLICNNCLTDTNPENNHKNHSTFTLENYHKMIKDKRKNLRFKSYNAIMKYIVDKETEITQDFSGKCNESKNYIDEAIKKLEELKEKYISQYDKHLANLKNIFSIIKESYKNFYREMGGDKIDLYSFDFISKIKEELNTIEYTPINFDLIKEIHTSLNKIKDSKYYNIKFNFRKLFYELSESIDTDAGVTCICPLKSINNSFACGLNNGEIKIYSKNDGEYSMIAESHKSDQGINTIIELEKTEKHLITGSSDNIIRIWSINSNNDKYSLSCKKEIHNDGAILSILELSESEKRIASSTSDNKIKIWYISPQSPKEQDIIIENKNFEVSYERCLVEASIFKNDEKKKQLISGGRKGILKCWDIYSGKRGNIFDLGCDQPITCMININNHVLAIGTIGGLIIIIDLFNQQKKYLNGHSDAINSMYYFDSKKHIFSCSKDTTIKEWDYETLKCTNILSGQHTSIIYGVCICGKDLISCSNDKTINIYSTEEDENDEYNDFENNNNNNDEEYNDFA